MNFIESWYLDNIEICDELIYFFNNDTFSLQNKKQGLVIPNIVNTTIKDSTDLFICPNDYHIPCIKKYLNELQKVCDKYIEKYEWSNKFSPWAILEGFNIQHYNPNGGFYTYHTERQSSHFPIGTRHLVFMTYLNNVEDGGETEWFYQKIKLKPKKGLTTIWPADWTHVHRGIPSTTQEKYIVTGWYNYYQTQ